jgi:hypothetical protein
MSDSQYVNHVLNDKVTYVNKVAGGRKTTVYIDQINEMIGKNDPDV